MTIVVPTDEFIESHTTEVELRDGTRVRIRPITPADKEALEAAFERLSPRSRYFRFMAPVNRLSDEMLSYLTEVDYVDHFAWGAASLDEPGEPGIGVARYVRVPGEPEVAEPAVAVIDDYQGRGLGTLLLFTLAESATQNGIRTFRAYVLGENEAMIETLRNVGATTRRVDGPTIEMEIELPLASGPLPDSLREALRAVARGEMRVQSPWERWLAWLTAESE